MEIQKNLQSCGSRFGRRTKKAKGHPDADVVAAATLLSVLNVLRANAHERAITREDLTVLIDAVLKGAQVEERESRMGALFYARIGAPQEVGDF